MFWGGDQSLLIHSTVHLSITWTEFWAYFFLLWICVATLRSGGSGWCWSGMVSLALKWLLLAREPCHFCPPHAASVFWRYLPRSFHMRISFQGRPTHAHMHIKNLPQKKLISRTVGSVGQTETCCSPFVPRFTNGKKHLGGQGKCQIVRDPSQPTSGLDLQFGLWISLFLLSKPPSCSPCFPAHCLASMEVLSTGFPWLKPWAKSWKYPLNIKMTLLQRHHPFWITTTQFSFQSPNNSVTDTSHCWKLEGR